jgi:hypothetical protein
MAKGKLNLADKENSNTWFYSSTYTKERVRELTLSLREWIIDATHKDDKFLFQKWAFSVGMNPSRISYLAERDPDFAEAFEIAKSWQEFKLQEDTLYKKTDYRMAMFMLCHHHGWKTTPDDDGMRRLGNEFGNYMQTQQQEYQKKKQEEGE